MKDLINNWLGSLKASVESIKTTWSNLEAPTMTNVTDTFIGIKDGVCASIQDINKIEAIAKSLEQAEKLKAGFTNISNNLMGPLLTDNEVYSKLLDYLSKFHTHVSENPAIQEVIDKLAHVEGYGGAAFHRIADGRHTILGAFEAVSKEMPEIPEMDRLTGAMEHLWHDFHSAVGLPIVSFANQESFKAFCETLHLSPHTVQDFLSVNSTELLSSALTIIPTMFRLNEMQSTDFAKVAAKMGILTIAGGQAEIIGSVFSLAMLGKAFFDTYHEGESYLNILMEAAKEGGWTSASVTAFALLPFPISISIAIVLPMLRAKIEAEGIESVKDSSIEYFNSVSNWVKDLDLSDLRSAVG